MSGAGSSSTEFTKVQGLAASLTESLDLLARDLTVPSGDTSSQGAQSRRELPTELSNILTGCRDVLRRLEDFVEKYSILDSEEVDPDKQWSRKARENVKRTWKKIVWTTEGSNIAELKQALVAHTNILQLAVSIINRQAGASVFQRS